MEAVLLMVAGVVAALALAAVALSGRKGTFWLAFVATLVPLEFVDRYYLDLPSSVKWLPEVAILVAAAASLVLFPGKKGSIPRALYAVWGALLAQALLSLALNRTSPVAFLLAQRGYLLLFASLLVLRAVHGIYDRDRLYAIFVGAGLVSSVVCLLQRFTIGASEPDRVTGLFSYGEVVLFYHLVCIGIVLAYWLEGRRVGGWNAGAAILLLVLSLAVGNQEAALPYFVLVLAVLFLRARARRGPLLAIGLALPVVMLGVFTLMYDASYESRAGSYSRAIFDVEYIKRYLFGEQEDVLTPGGDLLRGAAIVTAYQEVAGDRQHLLLGRGPGATSESGLAGIGALYQKFPGIGRVTLSLLIGDTGLLGVLLWAAFLVVVLRARPPPGIGEPYEHRLVREVVLALVFAYCIYARLTFEPCYAWLLALLLSPAVLPRAEAPSRAG